jgi:hypothetical protein
VQLVSESSRRDVDILATGSTSFTFFPIYRPLGRLSFGAGETYFLAKVGRTFDPKFESMAYERHE